MSTNFFFKVSSFILLTLGLISSTSLKYSSENTYLLASSALALHWASAISLVTQMRAPTLQQVYLIVFVYAPFVYLPRCWVPVFTVAIPYFGIRERATWPAFTECPLVGSPAVATLAVLKIPGLFISLWHYVAPPSWQEAWGRGRIKMAIGVCILRLPPEGYWVFTGFSSLSFLSVSIWSRVR